MFSAVVGYLVPVAVAFGLLAASPLNAKTRANQRAGFALEDYFVGTTYAYGKFSAINGVKREFAVTLDGKWDGKRLKLIEYFTYDDGEKDTKIWYFTKLKDGLYSARRDDVIGPAPLTIKGDVARYNYRVYLDAENKKQLVTLRDKLVLKDMGRMENTATVYKFGLPVGKVAVNFAKQKSNLIKP